jgi:hypothetical protein
MLWDRAARTIHSRGEHRADASARFDLADAVNQPSTIAHYQFSRLSETPMVKIRFARAVLHGLKPRKIRYDVHDSEETGLLLRVSPQGRKTWMVNYRSETGIRQQRALGKFPAMDIADARQAAGLAQNKTAGSGD